MRLSVYCISTNLSSQLSIIKPSEQRDSQTAECRENLPPVGAAPVDTASTAVRRRLDMQQIDVGVIFVQLGVLERRSQVIELIQIGLDTVLTVD